MSKDAISDALIQHIEESLGDLFKTIKNKYEDEGVNAKVAVVSVLTVLFAKSMKMSPSMDSLNEAIKLSWKFALDHYNNGDYGDSNE